MSAPRKAWCVTVTETVAHDITMLAPDADAACATATRIWHQGNPTVFERETLGLVGGAARDRRPVMMQAATFSLASFRPPADRPGPGGDAARIARNIRDNFYPTPPEATRALLSVERFDGAIWEPACGEGHIAKVLEAAGHAVVATDLNDRGFGVAGIDFLEETAPRARHIVSNPPYGAGLADAFVRQALMLTRETGGKVAMLLNLASLAHTSRTARWKRTPPARLYAIDGIVCWSDAARTPPRHFAEQRYVWAVWEHGHHGPAAFWWLSAEEFKPGGRS